MGISGDFAKLRRSSAQLKAVGTSGRLGLSTALAREVRSLVDLGFRSATAPDGTGWAPLKVRDGQPLRDTGRLQRSMTFRDVTENGFRFGTNVSYAHFHQFGTNGRQAASVRAQPVGKGGRFVSKKRAAASKRRSVSIRMLSFAAGSGKIPARPFLPTGGLPTRWSASLQRAGTAYLRTITRGG